MFMRILREQLLKDKEKKLEEKKEEEEKEKLCMMGKRINTH